MTVPDEISRSRYVSLTTYRKDGTAVATPVWHVANGGELVVVTEADTWKVKRIRSNSKRAESSGQCITTISQQLFEFLRRRFPSERFPWPPIELIGDLVQVKLIVRGKVGSFRKVLAEQAVGVLVATALPRRVRVAEEHRNVGGYGELGVRGHLDALVPGQRPSQRFG